MPTVIFDLGGVVLRWEPRRAYEQVLAPDEVDSFMTMIDFPAWNAGHDGGKPFADGEAELLAAHPDHEDAILAYRRHFPLTLSGMVPGTSAVIAELGVAGIGLKALTNWSEETFPHARRRFGLLRRFTDILVSGSEKVAKPDPVVFELALERFGLDPAETVFVDDAASNVAAAESVGIASHQFVDAENLRKFLVGRELLGPLRRIGGTVYHLADRTAWLAAQAGASYPWSSRGQTHDGEGYVHCCFTHQLSGVLDRYYADVDWDDLVLLELDTDVAPLVVEDLGGGPYPHLFTELTPQLVRVAHHGLGQDPAAP